MYEQKTLDTCFLSACVFPFFTQKRNILCECWYCWERNSQQIFHVLCLSETITCVCCVVNYFSSGVTKEVYLRWRKYDPPKVWNITANTLCEFQHHPWGSVVWTLVTSTLVGVFVFCTLPNERRLNLDVYLLCRIAEKPSSWRSLCVNHCSVITRLFTFSVKKFFFSGAFVKL
jgi:hypothetical protein